MCVRRTLGQGGTPCAGNALTVPRPPHEAVGLTPPQPDRHSHTSETRYNVTPHLSSFSHHSLPPSLPPSLPLLPPSVPSLSPTPPSIPSPSPAPLFLHPLPLSHSSLPPSPPSLPLKSQVGPGQYDITCWQRHQHSNGSCSVFFSLTPRLPQQVDTPRELLLNERLHPKGQTYPTPVESLG